ncbi:hypothetical protein AAFN86_08280 [Roseomonas sp. CAU 1739]|uniref:hypothetical protein n=1 Tax=Roseomonas sp. CAU 1739 TaxID=3140364 RepID=UPI00325AF9F2
MPWMPTILLGLLIGLIAGVYGGVVADAAVPWLRISAREGGSGIFVAFMILLGFIGGTIIGMVLCRVTGGPGLDGALRGFGIGLGGVLGIITLLGGLAWLSREVPPLVGGQPIDLAIQIRLPAGTPQPVVDGSVYTYVSLHSGAQRSGRTGPLLIEEARLEDGRWIIPGSVPIHISVGDRVIGVMLSGGTTRFFTSEVPARPATADGPWTGWRQPDSSSGDATAEGVTYEVRSRVVLRPPPPPPDDVPAPAGPAPLPGPDAPTEAWLAFTGVAVPLEIRARALAAVRDRPDFVPLMEARIASDDADTARDAMYLVGEMRPAPAALGDAVRRRAAGIVAMAEAIDPADPNSLALLYDRTHTLTTGVFAAAFGLRAAGVDIRPELRAIAAAAAPREKDQRDIVGMMERVVAYFDRLDREGRVLD